MERKGEKSSRREKEGREEVGERDWKKQTDEMWLTRGGESSGGKKGECRNEETSTLM